MRRGHRQIHSWSLGSLGYVLVVVRLVSLGSFGRAVGVVGFIRGSLVDFGGCRVHSDALWWSSGSLEDVGFIRVCPECR